MTSEEECFPSDYLMSHDTLLEFRQSLPSRVGRSSKWTHASTPRNECLKMNKCFHTSKWISASTPRNEQGHSRLEMNKCLHASKMNRPPRLIMNKYLHACKLQMPQDEQMPPRFEMTKCLHASNWTSASTPPHEQVQTNRCLHASNEPGLTDEYKIQGGTRIHICQQVFHKHTYSSHSNRIDKTYCSCYSRPQAVTVYCVSRKATCYLYFSLLKLIWQFLSTPPNEQVRLCLQMNEFLIQTSKWASASTPPKEHFRFSKLLFGNNVSDVIRTCSTSHFAGRQGVNWCKAKDGLFNVWKDCIGERSARSAISAWWRTEKPQDTQHAARGRLFQYVIFSNGHNHGISLNNWSGKDSHRKLDATSEFPLSDRRLCFYNGQSGTYDYRWIQDTRRYKDIYMSASVPQSYIFLTFKPYWQNIL